MTIVLFFIVMTAVAMALVLHPLLRDSRAPDRSAFDIEIYEDQLAELQRDVDRGLIDSDQAEAARVEIKRRILAAPADGDRPEIAMLERSTALPISLAFSVPVLCSTLYLALGSPGMSSAPLAPRQLPANHPPVAAGQPVGSTFQPSAEQRAEIQALPAKEQDSRINGMVDGLEQRLLSSSPNDLDGWMMLGRSRTVLGDSQAAAAAYQRALALVGEDDPRRKQITAKLIEVGGSIPQSPAATPNNQTPIAPSFQPSAEQRSEMQALPADEQRELIRSMVGGLSERLEDQPDDVNGWLMLARSRTVLGESEAAEAAYRRALDLLQPNDPRRQDVVSSLAQLGQELEGESGG